MLFDVVYSCDTAKFFFCRTDIFNESVLNEGYMISGKLMKNIRVYLYERMILMFTSVTI